MAVFLATWNPKLYPRLEEDWSAEGAAIAEAGALRGKWSMGNRNGGIAPGDMVFLVRQSTERGIVRSGIFTSEVYRAPHFDEAKANAGKTCNFADIEWSRQVDIDRRLPLERLVDLVPEVPWNNLMASGIRVPDVAVSRLISLWGTSTNADSGRTNASQRNPDWTWDEELLAFDVYLRLGPLDKKHPEVQTLSALLRSLRIHPPNAYTATFRNPNGVARKLGDIHTHKPGYPGKQTSGSRLDKKIWEEFGNKPEVVHQLAGLIRTGKLLAEEDEDEFEAFHHEGRITYRLHRHRERDRGLRKKKLDDMKKNGGGLHCEACDVKLELQYGTDRAAVYECHHLLPLSASGETHNRIKDLALLCPNCHRVAHRITPWPTLDELRVLTGR